MDTENKKIFLWVYYGGLIAGILLMNYAFMNQPDFVGELIERFWNLDKFQLISKDEFFFYVLFMRGKQIVFLLLCYLFFPRYLMLILLNVYFSFCLGGLLSLEAYYQGLRGILYGVCYFFPHFLCYGLIYYLAFRQAGTGRNKLFANGKKAVAVSLFLCLIGCLLESYVNSSLMIVLYGSN